MFRDKVTKEDIKAIFYFSFLWPFSIILKLLRKNIWLISERPGEARDNGFILFEYIYNNQDIKNVYYIIDKEGIDYKKIKHFKNLIYFGSIKHYLFYLSANIHISAHIDGGMPNRRVCDFLERNKLLNNKKVFLQHGVTKDLLEFTFYKNTRVNLFVCSAKPEQRFIQEHFGYSPESVKLIGLCRFDNLHDFVARKQILVMPTWRSWLAKNNFDSLEVACSYFITSEYYRKYSELLKNPLLNKILEDNNCDLIFYPHSDMQDFVHFFKSNSNKIKIANSSEYDIQQLLKDSSLLITDYSSVAFDFAYMNKPILYYQFDYDIFRQKQHKEGYYKYENDSFGPITNNMEQLLDEIDKCVHNNFQQNRYYEQRINQFFTLKDDENCKRTYREILKLSIK